VATLPVDLTDDDAPQRIVDLAVSRWGRVDFLVNNAGVGSPKPLHETDDEALDYFLDLMLRAPFRLTREVLPHMRPGSAIINITSTFAIVGGLRGGAYSAAKGGLTALTRHTACQYGAQGIRCNAVAPGTVLTEGTAGHYGTDAARAAIAAVAKRRAVAPCAMIAMFARALALVPPQALQLAQFVLTPASFDAGHIISFAKSGASAARTRKVRQPAARASR
jgi:NAD(P)-dependent dehydrogenase (short-subunit alcohol dehydrogenase family)